jgi:hypothetical protein
MLDDAKRTAPAGSEFSLVAWNAAGKGGDENLLTRVVIRAGVDRLVNPRAAVSG